MTNLSILLVDDDPMILKAMKNLLLEKDIQVDIASSVVEASAKIESKEQIYDAIVCDINMPKVSGIEFGKKYYDKYPILFITGFLEENLKDKILNICDAYIEKLEAYDRLYPAVLKAIQRKSERSPIRAA